MNAIIAFIPIIFTVIVMVKFNWPAKFALPAAWFITAIITFAVWKMDLVTIIANTISGALSSLDTLFTIFGAIIIMNTLKQSGGMSAINKMFTSISNDPRIQMVIIGFMFGSFIEGAAGFGTPAALAAPLLIGLGYPPLCAAMVALILDSIPVAFGAAGTPLTTQINTISEPLAAAGLDSAAIETYKLGVSTWYAIPCAIICPVIIFAAMAMMCKIYGKDKSIKPAIECLPYIIMASIVFDIPFLICSIFLGPEFPSMIGGVIALVFCVFTAQKGILVPKSKFEFVEKSRWEASWKSTAEVKESAGGEGAKVISPVMAWVPYVIIALILVLSRIPAVGIKGILNVPADLLGISPLAISIPEILGVKVNYVFRWAWNPGIIPFLLVSFLIIPLHGMNGKQAGAAWKESLVMISGSAAALIFGVAMVQLFRNSGADFNTSGMDSMLKVMANGLATLFGSAFIIVSPLIGIIGAFISGSCTISNLLFSGLQFETAQTVGLSTMLIAAMQSCGGAMGNMICVNNIVAACTTCGTAGAEGRLIRSNVIPCVIFWILTVVILGGLIMAGFDPYPLG